MAFEISGYEPVLPALIAGAFWSHPFYFYHLGWVAIRENRFHN